MPLLKCVTVTAEAALGLFLLAACATAPTDRQGLVSVHTIFLGPVIEPPDRPFFEAAGGPPRSLLGKSHFAEDARSAIGVILTNEGYKFVADASSADAVLTITVEDAEYGPDALFHQDCKPTMLIEVNLKTLARTKLIDQEYFYVDKSKLSGLGGYLLLRADPKYTVPDCSTFSEQSVMAAFHDAAPLIAQAVGSALAKQ